MPPFSNRFSTYRAPGFSSTGVQEDEPQPVASELSSSPVSLLRNFQAGRRGEGGADASAPGENAGEVDNAKDFGTAFAKGISMLSPFGMVRGLVSHDLESRETRAAEAREANEKALSDISNQENADHAAEGADTGPVDGTALAQDSQGQRSGLCGRHEGEGDSDGGQAGAEGDGSGAAPGDGTDDDLTINSPAYNLG